jgi:hypothetical protein
VQVIAMPWVATKINDYLAGTHHSPAYVQAIRTAWAEAGAHHGGLPLAGDEPEEEEVTQGVGVGEIAAGVQQTSPELMKNPENGRNPENQAGPSVIVTVNGQQEEFVSYDPSRGPAQQFVPSARRPGQNPGIQDNSRRGNSGSGYDEGPQLRPSQHQQQHQQQPHNSSSSSSSSASGPGPHVRAPYALPGSHYPETPQRLFHPDSRPTPRNNQNSGSGSGATPNEVRRAMGQFNRSGAGVAAVFAGDGQSYHNNNNGPGPGPTPVPAPPGSRYSAPGHAHGHATPASYGSRGRQPSYSNGYGGGHAPQSNGYLGSPNGASPPRHSGSGQGRAGAGSAVPVLPPIQRRGQSQGHGYEHAGRAYNVRPTQGYQSRNNSREEVKPTVLGSQQGRYVPSRPTGAPRRPPPGVQRASKWK